MIFWKNLLLALSLLIIGYVASDPGAVFLEQFDATWASRWRTSAATKTIPKKNVDGTDDTMEVFKFDGVWSVEAPTVLPGTTKNGLVLKSAATHHAISAVLSQPFYPKGKPLVFQYEVKLQNLLECGGAYAKLLSVSDDFIPNADKKTRFDDKTPYVIMFGPDRCGLTNKVHFIFRHKNPLTGLYEEKHLKNPPPAGITKTSTLYTLSVQPNNDFAIYINMDKVVSGNLLRDFEPAVNPPAEIDDISDVKPVDWVDNAKISDPDSVKPEDWDESAPLYIDDPTATKPDDWLDNEPLYINDPESVKPENWNEDEDGVWTPRKIPNPVCEEVSGCGKWTTPKIQNPLYKGKWTAPLIDNPAYKGPWQRRKIPNPSYYNDPTPCDFQPIYAVGFELWTLQNDILFDNIYLGHDEAAAFAFAKESWLPKFTLETQLEKAEREADDAKKMAEEASPIQGYIDYLSATILEILDDLTIDPVEASAKHSSILGPLLVTIVLIVYGLYKFMAKMAKKPASKGDSVASSNSVKIPLEDKTEQYLKENVSDSNVSPKLGSRKKTAQLSDSDAN